MRQRDIAAFGGMRPGHRARNEVLERDNLVVETVFTFDDRLLLFLLDDQSHEPGKWSLSGGFGKSISDTPIDVAASAFAHDSGIILPRDRFKEVTSTNTKDGDNNPIHYVLCRADWAEKTPPNIRLPRGAVQYAYFDPDDLPDLAHPWVGQVIPFAFR